MEFYTLYFLYNPSAISVSHSIDAANQVMPAYTRSDNDKGTPLVAAGGSLSFSLLFDRTYEMSDSSKATEMRGQVGVAIDVHVLYNMLGVNAPQVLWNQASASGGTSGDASVDAKNITGIMQMNPVWIYFAPKLQTQHIQLPNLSKMVYFGYVNSMNIAYTHFTQSMMPVRCAVSLSVQLMSSAGWS
ncbi:hypothetical protein ABZ543_12945 [Streptomyces roseifaciens]